MSNMKNLKELVVDTIRSAGRVDNFTLLSTVDGMFPDGGDGMMAIVEYNTDNFLKKLTIPYSLAGDYLALKAYIFDHTQRT